MPEASALEATLNILGLDCPDCARKLEQAIERLPGVTRVNLVFTSGKMNVSFDPGVTSLDKVTGMVKTMGYDAAPETGGHAGPEASPRVTTIRLDGLDCADCAAKLEKSIGRMDGVQRAEVNFGMGSLQVTHVTPVSAILNAIEAAGYRGEVEGKSPVEGPRPFIYRSRGAIATAAAGLLVAVGVVFGRMNVAEPAAIAVFLAAVVIGGFRHARAAVNTLIATRNFDMNSLMTIAVVGALAIKQWEEAAVIVFLFSLGNTLQKFTMDRTRNSIRSLMELTPKEALVRRGETEQRVPVEEILVGEIIVVRPGERIAMDGKVVAGSSSVNQAPITGESVPAEKLVGDEVYAGTINERGALEVLVANPASNNTLSRIIKLVEEAQAQRAPSQQFVDRFSRYYTPAVIGAAFLVATVPAVFFGQPFGKWFYEALGMLLVACPCALVISTPVSIVSAIGSAARNGVLVKGGAYLEEAGSLSVVAFDKTGTLTQGHPTVTDLVPLNGVDQRSILEVAAAVESRSEHPLAAAVVGYAEHQGLGVVPADNFQAFPGKGAKAEIGGIEYFIGNPRFFEERNISLADHEEVISRLQSEGKTVMIVGTGDALVGIVAVADVLRPNSRQAITSLKKAGIRKLVMLTGDNVLTAKAAAKQVGVDEFRAELLPEDKVHVVKQLLTQHGKVAMVGDGVNDAPAMAIATVGIAMGAAGTDTALETADIALMADDLSKLAYAILLSRRTLKTIKQNIAFSLIVKGLILLLVIPGWLTLWLAIAADMGSSLVVTLNGMRLLRVRDTSGS